MIEKIIVSTLIEGGLGTCNLIMPSITKEHFAGRERVLIELLSKKVRDGLPFDNKLLAEEMKGEDSEGYLNSLKAHIGKKSLLEVYIRKLADKRARERIVTICSSAEDADDFAVVAQITEERMLAQVEKKDFTELKYAAADTCEVVEKNEGVDFPFSYGPLQVLAAGINQTEVMVVGGYTSQGKSALCVKLADAFACGGHKVLYCTSEMSIKDIVIRLFCRRCRINSDKFRYGTLSDIDLETIASETLDMNIPLFLATVSTVHEIRAIAEKVKPDIIFVDHLHQLMGEGENEYQVVSSSMVSLKNIAEEKKVAMIVAAQLHRPEFVSKQGLPPRPRKSSFRGCGRIEENCQIIAFVYWPWGFTLDDEKNDKNEAQLIVAKNTAGSLGYSKVFFRPEEYEFLRWNK